MSEPKKIYTIRISSTKKPGIWYSNKKGTQYEAELKVKGYNKEKETGYVVFEVNPCQFVHPTDCEIISERLVEPYIKKSEQ